MRSDLSEVNTAMEMDQWARSDLKTSIPGTQLTVMDRTFEGNGVSQWSMGMNDHDHRRSDSVSLCSYHSGNERCCGYPNCLELIMERASWKPEKLRIFHCNDCGGTTIQEIRSLYIDGRLRRSYSMDRMQHDWHCSHCGFWNSNSDTVSIYKTTNLLNAKHFNSSSRTISRTSMLTSLTDLCKHPTPSASYHSQKHNKFSIRSNSIQCKHNKKCNEKFGQYMRSGGCNHAVINESQMGSSLMQKSKVEIEAVKWTATQEASIVKSTSTATAMESLKASPTRKNLLRSISAEESKGFQTVVARETEPKMKLLRTAKWTIDSTQSTTCKDDTESTLNEQMGNEKSLNSAVPLTPTTEVIVDQHNRGYDVGTGRSLPIDLLETALELNCEVIESSKKTRKTAKQISETDLKTAIEKTTTLLGDVNGCPTKYNG
uniref:CENP-V/GFA domain-containing protein n=1 Tax=Elaeophora elaphi TaxID=1147741 RepID=A0A0R3RFG3_9BILA